MGPTPPPPPVQQTSSTVQCEWCNQPMDSTAVRCSNCGKLKKSIYNDKIKSYIFCLIGGLGIGFSFTFLKGKSNDNDMFNAYYGGGGNSSDHTTGYILLAVGIIAALIGIYFYARVSQRLKTWWWM